MKTRHATAAVAALVFTVIFGACSYNAQPISQSNKYYIVGDKELQKELKLLFRDLEGQQENPESRFIIIQEITKKLHGAGENNLLNLFLSSYVETHKDDPYNGYYLLIVARNYLSQGAEPFAVQYFERILRNHVDLAVNGTSIHYVCLQNLIDLVTDPELKVGYYKSLLSRFPEKVERGPTYYFLAKTYEELGEWDLAIQAYRNFLGYPETSIRGVPHAHEQVRLIIEFYDYPNKNWTMESLEDLVSTVKYAMWTRNANLLRRYRAKVNFFAISWEEESAEANQNFLDGLGGLLTQRIHYNNELDRDSNNREAYLRTWGWSYRIKTWYLYFRRVNFPADPEIHGQWEWAGIYFGEKPFAGASTEDS
ncbi:MAG: hypothetical protein SVR04_01740 [Spirochaetota bacterium]|nr:hypothetical protein [Spirochaetota bacterium]